jgi:hypothetical protein
MTLDERERCAAAADAIVAQAPPLNAETRAKLRSLLAPISVPKQRTAAEQAATAPTP